MIHGTRPSGEGSALADEAQIWMAPGLHPNICSCHFVRRIDGVTVVLARYVPDGSLHQWTEELRIYKGPDAALRILDAAIQFAWGLGSAHHLVKSAILLPEDLCLPGEEN